MVCLSDIKKDLTDLEPRQFFMKHIIKSYNWYFSEFLEVPNNELLDKIDYFKEIISQNLRVSFHSSQLVGSAKLGYSLSPYQCLKPFNDGTQGEEMSDIDIAIVSELLYNRYWDMLKKTSKIYEKKFYNDLIKAIFRGFIDEKYIRGIEALCTNWDTMISPCNISLQNKLSIYHPVSYRIYRSWDDLEHYQMGSIIASKRKLQGGK